MNAFLFVIVVTLMAVRAFGQGQVNFNNRVVGVVVAPVYGINPYDPPPTQRISGNATTNGGSSSYTYMPLISGTNFTAQLWYGPEGSPMNALQPVTSPEGTRPFRSTAATAGFIQNTAAAATLNGISYGNRAALQMRVWDNRGGLINSWAAAIADPNVLSGASDVFTSLPLSPPEINAINMVGLTSFNLTWVPEPSVYALGALGLAVLLFQRRRR